MVSGRSEEQREAERTERQGPLNQVGWCQLALTPEGAQVGPLVVGIQLATGRTEANRGRLVLSGNISGSLSLVHKELWKSESRYEKSPLASKKAPVLGTVQGQGRQYMVQLGTLKGPGQTPDWEDGLTRGWSWHKNRRASWHALKETQNDPSELEVGC